MPLLAQAELSQVDARLVQVRAVLDGGEVVLLRGLEVALPAQEEPLDVVGLGRAGGELEGLVGEPHRLLALALAVRQGGERSERARLVGIEAQRLAQHGGCLVQLVLGQQHVGEPVAGVPVERVDADRVLEGLACLVEPVGA